MSLVIDWEASSMKGSCWVWGQIVNMILAVNHDEI